jgi:hypothetical protein
MTAAVRASIIFERSTDDSCSSLYAVAQEIPVSLIAEGAGAMHHNGTFDKTEQARALPGECRSRLPGRRGRTIEPLMIARLMDRSKRCTLQQSPTRTACTS